jgi:formylglycine-generating enzyme required for sulfatase activity
MKTNKVTWVIFLLAGFIVFSSFAPGKKKTAKAPEGYVFVPMGTCQIDSNDVSIQAFFMSKTEVTNKQYRTFLADLKAKGDMDAYKKALPDTTKWQMDANSYNQPMVENYFSHPAYDNYPVVNVSREGAEMYCQWLTKKYEAENGPQKCAFRLPQREEWIWAARGGLKMIPYPWGGPYLRNSKGCYLCNFRTLNERHITYNYEKQQYELVPHAAESFSEDGAFQTIITGHYAPNDYGLYDMSGNVAEMVAQSDVVVGGSWMSPGADVRIESVAPYSGPAPTVGFRPVMTYLGE